MHSGRYLSFAALAGALTLAAGIAQAAPPPAAALPAGWTAQDIAKTPPKTPGSTTVSGTGAAAVWTVTGTGGDVWDKADAGFQFAYTTLTGDGGITARLLTQTGGADTDWSKTGTMLRESTDPSAADAFLSYASATGGKSKLTFQPSWRANTGGKVAPGSTNPSDSYGTDAIEPIPGTHRLDKGPIYMRTQRQGTTYQHLVSDDGKNWLLLGSETVNIDPSKPVLAGIWASQGGSKTPNVVTYDNVGISSDVIQPVASTQLPAPTNVTAIAGSGAVLLVFTPARGAVGTNVYRQTQGGTDKPVLVNAQPTANGWIIDTGVTNGTTYLYTIKSVIDLTKLGGGMVEAGATAQVVVEPQAPVLPGLTLTYLGTPKPATAALASGVLTLTAQGSDIWDTTQNGIFLATAVSGDYSMNAKVLAQPLAIAPNKSNNVKVGPMIEDQLDNPNQYGFVFTTSGRTPNEVLFEGRTNVPAGKNFSDAGTKTADTKYPLWLKLSKKGSVLSAFQSNDGTTFTAVGTPHDYGELPALTYTGIGMSSGDAKNFGSAMLDAASIQIGAP